MTNAKHIIIRRKSDPGVRLIQATGRFYDRGFDQPVIIPGHAYPPILMTGPVETPDYTTCLIEWTVNIPAYHRVRYKKPGGGWTVTAWTTTKSTNASINLTGL